eukprot:TRINITY_DN296_c1_g1_i1.p1 TRINITY_DN296_c1_g1~~TRINITY_DN296_c1_g1_i1.p1  ORF type:complete len:341 (+),score=165.42 TRINITY_DN296_c1_g1_i1:155-1177(+)
MNNSGTEIELHFDDCFSEEENKIKTSKREEEEEEEEEEENNEEVEVEFEIAEVEEEEYEHQIPTDYTSSILREPNGDFSVSFDETNLEKLVNLATIKINSSTTTTTSTTSTTSTINNNFNDFKKSTEITLQIETKSNDENNKNNNNNNNNLINQTIQIISPIQVQKITLNDFIILKVIGRGGFGKVLLVKKKNTNEIFAMKVLKKDFLIKTKNVGYTMTERNVLRRVRHPFIVSLHYAFQNAGKLYLVMDFMAGGQLFYHLRLQTTFTEDMAKFYAAEIVLALEHLHSQGIVHRDLKPENILLNASGHVALTDFGFAKEDMGDNQTTGSICGTIEYMGYH